MFTPHEIERMEYEMYSYLESDLTIDIDILADFEKTVKLNFGSTGLYPTTGASPVPSIGYCHQFRPVFILAHPPLPSVMPSNIHGELDIGMGR
jgi:hypothetical protein